MIPKFLKRFLGRTSELVLSVVVVVVFFALFLVILSLSFPQATSLGDLLVGRDDAPKLAPAPVGKARSGTSEEPTDRPFIAELSSVIRRVKDKAPAGVAWHDSTAGTRLADGHAVQTLSRSGAAIEFDDTNWVDLGENTLLIVQRLRQDKASKGRHAALVVIEGELRATLDADTKGLGVEIVAGAGTAALRAAAAGSGSSTFRITADKDRSSTVTVFDGTASVQAGDRTVEVGRRQTLRVTPDGQLVGPRDLPAAVEALAPADGTAYPFRTLAPKVEFSWKPVQGVDRYRFLLASDADFKEVLYDAPVNGTSFSHGNLRAGRYWWRVAALEGKTPGPPSLGRDFEIVQDATPPTLNVVFPQDSVGTEQLVLQGSTEPGVTVIVGEDKVQADAEGTFTHPVRLKPGANMIVVQAVDAAGNVAYASNVVSARF